MITIITIVQRRRRHDWQLFIKSRNAVTSHKPFKTGGERTRLGVGTR